jgi:hypothetical protein
MKVAVVSAIYGGYDHPKAPVPQDHPCEFVLVTDDPTPVDGWQVVYEPRPQLHPRLAAKVPKCRPDLYADADAYLWVDGSIEITSPGFVTACVGHLEVGPVAQFPHPLRSSIAAEAEASMAMAKYHGLPVREQAAHYIKSGYPDGWGLWETGIIARRRDGLGFGADWLTEQVRWTYQDQVSQAPVMWAAGVRPIDLPGLATKNPWTRYRHHTSEL